MLDVNLNKTEVRVVGALVEKSLATPEYYPLTLKALTAACNQKSNRDPVMQLDEKDVVRSLDSLREMKLAWMVHQAGARAPKYEHRVDEVFGLDELSLAVMCELMVRGPQTLGELRSHAGRFGGIRDRQEVEDIVDELENRDGGALVARLPRQPGRKESRYCHLLAGEPEAVTHEEPVAATEPARQQVEAENRRVTELADELAALRQEIDDLRREFDSFRRQFE